MDGLNKIVDYRFTRHKTWPDHTFINYLKILNSQYEVNYIKDSYCAHYTNQLKLSAPSMCTQSRWDT